MDKLTLKDILAVLAIQSVIFFSLILNMNMPLIIIVFFVGIKVGIIISTIIFYRVFIKK